MATSLITLVLLCASLSARVTGSPSATADDEGSPGASSAKSVNSVIDLVAEQPGGAQRVNFERVSGELPGGTVEQKLGAPL